MFSFVVVADKLYISWINPLSDMLTTNIFSHSGERRGQRNVTFKWTLYHADWYILVDTDIYHWWLILVCGLTQMPVPASMCV